MFRDFAFLALGDALIRKPAKMPEIA